MKKIDELKHEQMQQQQFQSTTADPWKEKAAMKRVSRQVRQILKDIYQRQFTKVNIPGAAKGYSLKDLYINVKLHLKVGGRLTKDLIENIFDPQTSTHKETKD